MAPSSVSSLSFHKPPHWWLPHQSTISPCTNHHTDGSPVRQQSLLPQTTSVMTPSSVNSLSHTPPPHSDTHKRARGKKADSHRRYMLGHWEGSVQNKSFQYILLSIQFIGTCNVNTMLLHSEHSLLLTAGLHFHSLLDSYSREVQPPLTLPASNALCCR